MAGEFSADTNKACNNGWTPIYRAAQSGNEGVLRLLVSYGAGPSPKWTSKFTEKYGGVIAAVLREQELPLQAAVRATLGLAIDERGVCDIAGVRADHAWRTGSANKCCNHRAYLWEPF